MATGCVANTATFGSIAEGDIEGHEPFTDFRFWFNFFLSTRDSSAIFC